METVKIVLGAGRECVKEKNTFKPIFDIARAYHPYFGFAYNFYVVNSTGDGHCAGFKVKELKLNK